MTGRSLSDQCDPNSAFGKIAYSYHIMSYIYLTLHLFFFFLIQICSNLVINYKLEIYFNDVGVLFTILFYFKCLYYLVLLLLHCGIKNSMVTDRLLQLICNKLFENINFLKDKILLIR